MQGAISPIYGTVELEGISLDRIGATNYRGVISTVMQDDNLFVGSIYENICFHDERPDSDWVYECARSANIHSEIMSMPMRYQTLVGDMGTVLSGAQKQRVLIALSLYVRPQILFLDEATSHLDSESELKIGKAIAALNISPIMVAHRPQTIALATRVLILSNGRIVSDSKG